MRRLVMAVSAVAVLAGCGGVADDDTGFEEIGQIGGEVRPPGPPNGKGIGTIKTTGCREATKMSYHGGPVMQGASNVYLIWYGNWAGNSAQEIIADFLVGLGSSAYFKINTKYADALGNTPSGALFFGGSVDDNYSKGVNLSDADLASVVVAQLEAGQLPVDASGIYVVLTSADVNATSGFCKSYCGQHSSTTYAGSQIKYAFVGNPDRCPGTCAAQRKSPNGNPGADAMANILANELSATVTDPLGTAWYDKQGYENADKCAWTFGTTYAVANGAAANMKLSGRDFLIQRNWYPTRTGGTCAMSIEAAKAAGADRWF